MEVAGEVEVEVDVPTSSTVLPTTADGTQSPVPIRVILPTSCECLLFWLDRARSLISSLCLHRSIRRQSRRRQSSVGDASSVLQKRE